MLKRTCLTLVSLFLLSVAVSACGSSSSHDPAVNSAKAQATAVAHTQANTKAETDVKAEVHPCVSPYENQPMKLFAHSARKALVACIKGLVPKGKQTQAENCAIKAAAHDKVWRKSGLKLFEDSSAATCVEQATAKA